MSERKSKTQAAWDKLLEELTSHAREKLSGSATEKEETADSDEYLWLVRSLPTPSADAFQSIPAKPPSEPDDVTPRWCLCEMPEGGYPKIRIFHDLAGLCRHITRLEGEEISVWPFYGVPIRFTTSRDGTPGRRYVFLPHEAQAVELPCHPEDEPKLVPTEGLNVGVTDALDFQYDGWLGDPALAEASLGGNYYQGGKPPKLKKPPEEDFEDDEPEDNDLDNSEV